MEGCRTVPTDELLSGSSTQRADDLYCTYQVMISYQYSSVGRCQDICLFQDMRPFIAGSFGGKGSMADGNALYDEDEDGR